MDISPQCPECGRTLLRNGVMLRGNVLTGEPSHPVARWDCPDCLVMVSSDIDEEEGWRQWEAQGNKRPQPAREITPCRVALAFELVNQGESLCLFGRPQDFRVKSAQWQYAELFLPLTTPDGTPVNYQVFAYARYWNGKGRDVAELDHRDHPKVEEIGALVAQAAEQMGGFPVSDRWEPMAWGDPLKEDDFLDEADDPVDFAYWEGEEEDDLDFDY